MNQNYTGTGYDCMKNISATVLNSTHLTCRTIATQNGSPARVTVSMDNGATFSNTTAIEVVPGFEWALGRRPYVGEPVGSIIYKVHPSMLAHSDGPVSFELEGRLRPHHGNESGDFTPHYFDHHTTAGIDFAAAGAKPLIHTTITVTAANLSGELAFPITGLPDTVYEDFVLTVSTGKLSATKWKRFHKVPVPDKNSNVTIFSVDHTTAGMLLGQGESPWLPFTALGWFNSPFEYAHESIGDMSLIAKDVSTYVARGGSFATEWSKKGHTLIRVGDDHQRDPETLLAILDECERAGIYMMYTPSMANAIVNTHESGFPMENLISNITLIKDHPALWGYYICDDCCKGFDFLWELAWVYDAIKRIDPYHLTAGFAECGELHAFQEPHLSLDAPIRENYRPEMAYHHNDGSVDHPGSDASLRMPPNTFEPVFNGLQAERQVVPDVARSNAYLGLITANLIHHNWYVFNPINYIRWQNVNLVDKTFAEFQELGSSVLSPFMTQHPSVTVLEETATLNGGNIRTRAWRNPDHKDGCVHLVVVNSVQEGVAPEPSMFKLKLSGLTTAEISGGATPIWGMGCVVNFTQPPMQAALCRNVPLHTAAGSRGAAEEGQGNSRGNGDSATLSDMIGPTDTTIYQIGCKLPPAAADNYAADPGFEGGLDTHPMPGPPGVPGYNLDDHQATWGLIPRDEDGIVNGRSYDDSTWLRIDTTRPHSGTKSGRIALPTGARTYVRIPCQRGDEHFKQAKGDKVCHGGLINVLNDTSYTVSIWARGSSSRGGSVQLVHLMPAADPQANNGEVVKVGHALTLTTEWQQLTSALAPAQVGVGTLALTVEGWAPGKRAATVWLDDAVVHIANQTYEAHALGAS